MELACSAFRSLWISELISIFSGKILIVVFRRTRSTFSAVLLLSEDFHNPKPFGRQHGLSVSLICIVQHIAGPLLFVVLDVNYYIQTKYPA